MLLTTVSLGIALCCIAYSLLLISGVWPYSLLHISGCFLYPGLFYRSQLIFYSYRPGGLDDGVSDSVLCCAIDDGYAIVLTMQIRKQAGLHLRAGLELLR